MKPLEEIRQHFIDRLKERHGLIINDNDYAILNGNARKLSTLFRKTRHKKIVKVPVLGKIVPALFCMEQNALLTVYPRDVLTNEIAFLRACFPSRIHPIIFMVAGYIRQSITEQAKQFESDKEAALYFHQQCTFPTLMTSIRKHGNYPFAHMARIIDNILEGNERTCALTVRAFDLDEKKQQLRSVIEYRKDNNLSNRRTKQIEGKLKTLMHHSSPGRASA